MVLLTSLLDLVVFGRRAGNAICSWLKECGTSGEPENGSQAGEMMTALRAAAGKEKVPLIRRELQQVMMEHCSVFRDEKGLTKAREKVDALQERYRNIGLSVRDPHFNLELIEAMECGHLLTLAAAVIESALYRRESRGAHYRADYPARDDDHYLAHTMISLVKEKMTITTSPVSLTRFQPVERKY